MSSAESATGSAPVEELANLTLQGEQKADPPAEAAAEGVEVQREEGAETKVEEVVAKDKEKAQQAKSTGNKHFGTGDYAAAALCYSEAILLAPDEEKDDLAVFYSNRAACYLMQSLYERTVEDCTKALELKSPYPNCLQRRAQAYEKMDKLIEAYEDYKKLLEADPRHAKALDAVRRLEPEVKRRQEQQKEEMLGKLKELGNSLLGKFGLSLDNFKATQDPNTGSYSISFQQ